MGRPRSVSHMRIQLLLAAALAVLAVALLMATLRLVGDDTVAGPAPSSTAGQPSDTTPDAGPTDATPEPTTESTPQPRLNGPWGEVMGVTQFRGNPRHTWYGSGPVPSNPTTRWRYPESAMCSTEVIGQTERVETDPETGEDVTVVEDETRQWCGTGWTGQPVVWQRPDGVTEVIFGAYDGAVHFLDAATGARTRPPFMTGFMIKGTVTLDPDGFPLLYTGSRDNFFRIIALDRPTPTELWRQEAHAQRVWNNDWDGNASVVDDVLWVGGEDSWLYAIQLNRSLGEDGLVAVDPDVLLEFPGWTEELFAAIGDRNVSIENSVVIDIEQDRVYAANSGGRVVGLDMTAARAGRADIVFDVWLGDDIDASLVIDDDGMLIAAIELERNLPRSAEVGQLVKLDPFTAGNPIVWSVAVPPDPAVSDPNGGIWATPALHEGVVWVPTHPGDLLGVDATTGEVIFREDIGFHEWGSPSIVDSILVVPLCEGGGLRAWSLADPRTPVDLWTMQTATGACIESTPTIWKGQIFVGSRDGFFYAFD